MSAADPSVAGFTAQPLSSVNVSIVPGDRIALSGPSGSGKSVLLRTLAMLDHPVAGAVHYRGHPVAAQDVPQYRRAIAYFPQRATLTEDTVRDALAQPFQLRAHRARHYDEAHALALLQIAGKPASFLDKASANLSGGEAQIAALVRGLLLAPEVLLLDEPTAALDPASAAAVEALVDGWMGRSHAALNAAPHAADATLAHDGAAAAPSYVWISHDPAQAQRVGRTRWMTGNGRLMVSTVGVAR
jgi:putative ABC transport system ATP-binding protein